MKKIISIILLLATVATVSAQRFEWAKGFESCLDYGAQIYSSATDSIGNLYILGRFEYDAEWMSGNGGIPLLPEAQFLYQIPHISVLIAKISPEGEMLWKKVVCNDNGGAARPYALRLVGDTAIACMFDFTVPCYASRCYYLDTFLVGFSEDNYPCNALSFAMTTALALVTFDFDGNVIEDHFLRLTAVDNSGNDILTYCWLANVYTGLLGNMFIQHPTFNIDRAGNIYLYRQTNDIITDSLCVTNGAFSALKIWDDTRLVGTFPVEGSFMRNDQQILKFSPHFDTLLASRYVIQNCGGTICLPENFRLLVDDNSNLYTTVSLQSKDYDNSYTIDSIQNIIVSQKARESYNGFMVKYDSDLNVKWVVDFMDTVLDGDTACLHSLNLFQDISIDEDSGYVFLSAFTQRLFDCNVSNSNSDLLYNDEFLNLQNDAFVVSFHNTNSQPLLHSCCRVPSLTSSSYGTSLEAPDNLVCKNNRIFSQAQYLGGLRYNDVNQPAGYYDRNLGFFVFDYAGHVVTHNSYDIDNRGTDRPGPIALRDSILYLMPDIHTHATFGETTIYSCQSYACIAKYVDTSFMSLYVRPVHDVGIQTLTATPSVTLYPNPATTSLSIVSDTPVAQQAYIINSIGIRMPVTIQNNTLDVSRLSPGNYFLETYINNNKVITKFVKL